MTESAQNALFDAIRSNDLTAAKAAVARGGSVKAWDDNGLGVLHLAVGRDAALLIYLLSLDAAPNMADDMGFTPLMQAVAEKDFATADILLAHGADVNHQEAAGKITALHSAVFADNRGDDDDGTRVRYIMSKGGDNAMTMNWQGEAELTARDLAQKLQGAKSALAEVIDSPDMPGRRQIASARAAFMVTVAARSIEAKKRYTLK